MSLLSVARRSGAALLAFAVTAALVVAGGSAHAAPADRGADWLGRQLTGGLVEGSYFDTTTQQWVAYDDYGLSIDTAFALRAIGGHASDLTSIRDALAPHVQDYTGKAPEQYAGPTAKLLVLVQSTGGDPTSFGGFDLVRQLNRLVSKSGPTKGRIGDVSAYGDYANLIGQVLAVRGLTAAHSPFAQAATSFLLAQQCDAGYFRLDFSKPGAAQQGCGRKSAPDPDATSYAVVQLWRTSKDKPVLRRHLKLAAAWLASQQRRNGSFVGGTSTETPNSNSTGLAGWALADAGRCSAARAAATWVAGLQVGTQAAGSPLAGQRGAIAYDGAAMRSARTDGIPANGPGQDQWRRATTQAAPVLVFRHGC
jgi:hypothetical protein